MIYFKKRLYECHGKSFIISKRAKEEALFVPVQRMGLGFLKKSGESFWDFKERYRRVRF